MGVRWGIFGFLKPNHAQQITPDLLKLVPDWYPTGPVRIRRALSCSLPCSCTVKDGRRHADLAAGGLPQRARPAATSRAAVSPWMPSGGELRDVREYDQHVAYLCARGAYHGPAERRVTGRPDHKPRRFTIQLSRDCRPGAHTAGVPIDGRRRARRADVNAFEVRCDFGAQTVGSITIRPSAPTWRTAD
jgi:hypothetical protein